MFCLLLWLNPKILQNSKYFFASDEILLVYFTMFLFSSLKKVPFSNKFKFRSACICRSSFNIFSLFELSHNVSRNLNWSGKLYIIQTVIGFVFGIRSLIKTFPILFEIHLFNLTNFTNNVTHYTSALRSLLITAAFNAFTISLSSSIFVSQLFILKFIKCRPLFLNNFKLSFN